MISAICKNCGFMFLTVVGIFGIHIALAHSYNEICIPSLNDLQFPLSVAKYMGSFASPVCGGILDLMKYTQNTYSMLIGAIFTILMTFSFSTKNSAG